MLVTGNQLKAARSLAGIEQTALASAAKVHVNTIRKIEAKGVDEITSAADVVRRIQVALEAAGIEFLNHGQPGVRLKKGSATDHPKPVGPASDVIERMDTHLADDKAKRKR